MKFYNVLFLLAAVASMSIGTAAQEASRIPFGKEPVIRIGLSTNASSVSITTTDPSLVAHSPDEPAKMLDSTKVSVTARAYRPPVTEVYHFEIQNFATADEANSVAGDVREATGGSALVSVDPATNTWRVWIGGVFETEEDAAAFKAVLDEKGFDEAVRVAEKKTVVSDEAIALSQQVRSAGKSQVRSLVKPVGDTRPVVPVIGPPVVDPNLREVIVSGPSEAAKYSSLKAVSFGSLNERATPVRLNGKAYRGRISVFVNAKGSLTVVNEVPLEDYLLGVVPAELGLPQLEAQKAQAIAARTYAVANINGYGAQGFDMVPTVYSQVYKGVSIETAMGTRAVRETAGMIASYHGKPIMAYFTSTCGGRTENSENIFDHGEPYLRGVECALEGRRHFEPFLIRTIRTPAKIRDESALELVRLMSLLAVNGFSLTTTHMNDEWFEDTPSVGELSNWLNQLASKFGKVFPNVTRETAQPLNLAAVISALAYSPGTADTLLSDSDVNYQLAFDDAAEVPAARRADLAMLLRDGYFLLRPDLTLKPSKPFSRGEMLRLIRQIYEKRNWMPTLQSGTTRPSVDGKLVLRVGKSDRQLAVKPDVFLFRKFGERLYSVKETALVGGESVKFQTDAGGAVWYMEVEPTDQATSAESMSPFTNWTVNLSPAAVQSRLSRYVRGIGTLYDVNVTKRGYSRRAVELEIIGSNGTKRLAGGKIRSALRLKEQLFVINKRYSGSAVTGYTFTGRGWGHGVGMCQYGAYGLAKMGVKADQIIKHYYSGVDVSRAY